MEGADTGLQERGRWNSNDVATRVETLGGKILRAPVDIPQIVRFW